MEVTFERQEFKGCEPIPLPLIEKAEARTGESDKVVYDRIILGMDSRPWEVEVSPLVWVRTLHAPNLLHRTLQRWFLGFKWTRRTLANKGN